ncbi:MAG: hypothetical protein AAGE99_02210 [Chlamydiota bacterium]
MNKEAWKKSNDHFPFVVLGFDEKFNIHILYKWKRSELSLESRQKVLRLLVKGDYVHSEQMLCDFSRENSLTTNQILTIDYEILVKKDGKNYLGFEPDYDVIKQRVVQENPCQNIDKTKSLDQPTIKKRVQNECAIRDRCLTMLVDECGYNLNLYHKLKWSHINFDEKCIQILNKPKIPLCQASLDSLNDLKKVLGTQDYVFMNAKESDGKRNRLSKGSMRAILNKDVSK